MTSQQDVTERIKDPYALLVAGVAISLAGPGAIELAEETMTSRGRPPSHRARSYWALVILNVPVLRAALRRQRDGDG
jgi:hypothetical protein